MARPRKVMVEASETIAKKDKAFRKIVRDVGPADLRRGRPHREHFAELARAIIFQQLAGKAASAIEGRFNALFDGVIKTLKKEGSVTLVGFGTYRVVKRGARAGRNPRTGEPIKIGASKSVRFKASKSLRAAV